MLRPYLLIAPIAVALAVPASSSSSPTTRASALVADFGCIHRYEGSWTAATGNGYYGGLQMDSDFMRAYGREFLAAYGTADKWPPMVQVAVAMRAYLSGRGFWPWPNSARLCGLL